MSADTAHAVQPVNDDDIRTITDNELVARGLEAKDAHERRVVEYEMWRRSTLLSRRSIYTSRGAANQGWAATLLTLNIAVFAIAMAVTLAGLTAPAKDQPEYGDRAFDILLLGLLCLVLLADTVRRQIKARRLWQKDGPLPAATEAAAAAQNRRRSTHWPWN
jgi:hypothetical protein